MELQTVATNGIYTVFTSDQMQYTSEADDVDWLLKYYPLCGALNVATNGIYTVFTSDQMQYTSEADDVDWLLEYYPLCGALNVSTKRIVAVLMMPQMQYPSVANGVDWLLKYRLLCVLTVSSKRIIWKMSQMQYRGVGWLLKYRLWRVLTGCREKSIHSQKMKEIKHGGPYSLSLIEAIERKDRECVMAIIRTYPESITIQDKDGKTALHHSACSGRSLFISALAKTLSANKKEFAINMQDHSGKAAIHYAVELVYLESIKILISHGADIELEDNRKQRPLHCAIATGFQKTIDLLMLQPNIDVNAVDVCLKTPLLLAVANGIIPVAFVEKLCDRGADVNAKDNRKQNPLHIACLYHSKEMCIQLIQRGSEIYGLDNEMKTPMHYASARFSQEIFVEFLNCANEMSKQKLIKDAFENADENNANFLDCLCIFIVRHSKGENCNHVFPPLEPKNEFLVKTVIIKCIENLDSGDINVMQKMLSFAVAFIPLDVYKKFTQRLNIIVKTFLEHSFRYTTKPSTSELVRNTIRDSNEGKNTYLKLLVQFEFINDPGQCRCYLSQALTGENKEVFAIILNILLKNVQNHHLPDKVCRWMQVEFQHLSSLKENHPIYLLKDTVNKEGLDTFLEVVDSVSRKHLIDNIFTHVSKISSTIVQKLLSLVLADDPMQCSEYVEKALKENNQWIGEISIKALNEVVDPRMQHAMRKMMHVICDHLRSRKERNIVEIWPALFVDGQEPVACILKSVYLMPREKQTSFFGIPVRYKRHNDLSPEAFIVSHSKEEKEHLKTIPSNIVRELNKTMETYATQLKKDHSNLTIMSVSSVRSKDNGKTITPMLQGKACIVLHCRHKRYIPFGEQSFPKYLDQFPVDVREGIFVLNSATLKKNNSTAPGSKCYHEQLRMGCSIAKKGQCTYGTLGCFVKSENNIGFLTCAHVLADQDILSSFGPDSIEDMETGIHPIVNQPADGHPGNNSAAGIDKECGKVCSMVFTASYIEEDQNSTVDAAFVKITKNNRIPEFPEFVGVDESSVQRADFKDGIIPSEIQLDIRELPQEECDIEVFKVGAATEFTQGSVCLSDTYVWQNYDIKFDGNDCFFKFYKQRQILSLYAEKPFFSGGDSGALIFSVDENDKDYIHCVGLAIGNCYPSNHCVFTPISTVLSKFDPPLQLTNLLSEEK